jgi:hypothetical protein
MTQDFKIAALCTAYWPASHADVIVTRWMQPYPGDERWGWQPRTHIASLYVMQDQPRDGAHLLDLTPAERQFTPGVELGRAYAKRNGVPMFHNMRDALTLGGESLAVDGVLIIGEHGNFAYNEYGQHLYPRKEMFDAVTEVFKHSARCVPVFVDKHLSWSGPLAREMANTARDMGFPLMAGSSLPCTMTLKPVLPPGAVLRAGVALFYVGPEVYGFHSLEGMQSIFEKRPGGERGIRTITAFAGAQVWEAMDNGAWPRSLFDAALAAIPDAKPGDPRINCAGTTEHGPSPTAFLIERIDGLREAHVNLNGHISDFAIAVETAKGAIHANRWEAGGFDTFFHHFAVLNTQIERMFLENKAPVPVERTLLTSMTIERCMHALRQPGVLFETPDLQISYS